MKFPHITISPVLSFIRKAEHLISVVVTWTSDPKHQKAIVDTTTTIVHYEERALPIMENIAAQFIPGAAPLMPVVAKALDRFNMTMDHILAAKTAAEQAGLIIGVGGEALRQDLVGFVKQTDNGIDLAGQAIGEVSQLDAVAPEVFQSVVTKAAASVAVAGKISTFLHDALDLASPPVRPEPSKDEPKPDASAAHAPNPGS